MFLIYLGLSPIVAVFYGWPGFMLAAVLSWLARLGQHEPAKDAVTETSG